MNRRSLRCTLCFLLFGLAVALAGCSRKRQPPVRERPETDTSSLGMKERLQGTSAGAPLPTGLKLKGARIGRGGGEETANESDDIDREIDGHSVGPRDAVDPGTLQPEEDAGVTARPRPMDRPAAGPMTRPAAMTPPRPATTPPRPAMRRTPPSMDFPPRAMTPTGEMAAP